MKWSLVLLSIFGLTTATPIDSKSIEEALLNSDLTKNSVLEEQLNSLLEDLRGTILTGSESVPVLDPFKLDYLAIDEQVVPVPGLSVAIRDATVTKLSTFVIEELTVQRTTLLPLRYRASIDLLIPVVEIDARHYDLSVVVNGNTIDGTGDAKINIIEPRITGHVIARPSIGFGTLFIQLQECKIKFSLKAFEPQINGLLGGDPAVGAFINAFLRFFIPDLIILYEEQITETLSSLVLQYGNEILRDINLISIIGSSL